MKQRITYLLHEAGGVDPATLDVDSDSIKLPGLKAAKEWRVTLGTRELPKEVWRWPLLICSFEVKELS
jgi:hypothetical protein